MVFSPSAFFAPSCLPGVLVVRSHYRIATSSPKTVLAVPEVCTCEGSWRWENVPCVRVLRGAGNVTWGFSFPPPPPPDYR